MSLHPYTVAAEVSPPSRLVIAELYCGGYLMPCFYTVVVCSCGYSIKNRAGGGCAFWQ